MAEIVGCVALPPCPTGATLVLVPTPPPSRPSSAPPRTVLFLAFPDLQVLDLTGPYEVFSLANQLVLRGRLGRGPADGRAPSDRPPYALEVASLDGAPVRSSGGLTVAVDRRLGSARAAAGRGIDTLVVPGGNGVVDVGPALAPWLAVVGPTCRRVTSVCTGSMLLAAAGLLDGRRATTHWTVCDLLAAQHPSVTVDPDPIFVRDGDVWTSAGITAGIDLALALVEDDLGADAARHIARHLVMFVQRPGGQAQFSTHLAAAPARRSPLRDLQGWIADHPEADLSVAALAERVHMSVRHFSRVFREELGVTPADYVERARVEAARQQLERGDDPVEAIARACGFGTPETMQRTFRRVVGVTPSAYRSHFHRRPA